MDKIIPFSEFRRQSKKGIIVIYGNILFSAFKSTWILLLLFIQKFSKIPVPKMIYVYLVFSFLLIFFLVRAFLIFKNFQFKIEKNHFILNKGILKKTKISIPFDRIQNINFKQNLVQQIINVYEVNIDTAGSIKAEISIKALPLLEANALKKIISTSQLKSKDDEIKKIKKPFLKIDFSALLKVSFTENHLQSLMLLFAILIGLYQQIHDVFEGFGKQDFLKNYSPIDASNFQTSFYFIGSLLLLLTFVAIFSSFVRVLIRHFNLTVFLDDDNLEINQGLFTKKSIVLKKEKVQHITVSDNPLKRILGISFIRFRQAISGKVNKKIDKVIKIVGCKANQIQSIKTLLYPNESLEGLEINRSANYYRFRLYLRSLLILISINIALFFTNDSLYFMWVNVVLLPIFVLFIGIAFKKRNYLFNDNLLKINSGVIETHQTFLPFFKVQNVKLKQTIFQTKRNIADVVFQTASGKVKIPCISIDKALIIYNYTLYKVADSNKKWM